MTDTTATATSIPIDNRLSYMYDFVKIAAEDKELFSSRYNVLSFDDLLNRAEDLKYGGLRHIDRLSQQTLWKCILWYKNFLRIFRREPNLRKELTNDAFLDFEANDRRIHFPPGDSLRHVLAVLNYSANNDLQDRLVDLGILTFDDVIRYRKQLEEGTFGMKEELDGSFSSSDGGKDIPKRVQTDLFQVVDWFDDFYKTACQPDLKRDFNEEVFESFIKKHHVRYNLTNVEQFYFLTKGDIHKDEQPSFIEAFRNEERPIVCKQIENHAKKDVEQKYISSKLREFAPHRQDELIIHCVEKIINFQQEDTFRTPFVIAGQTQSGKTPFKAVVLAVCRALNVPAVIITKGVPESRELHQKLQEFANADDRDLVVGSAALRKSKSTNNEIKRVLEKGGAIVVADTHAQMVKVNAVIEKHWTGKKIIAIVDEGDAMYRTGDRSQRFETSYDAFMSKRPIIRLFVTATPVPALLALTVTK